MNLSVSQLEQVLAESRLSPEQLGSRMGISGMTIRRWIKDPQSREQGLAPLYCRGLMDCVHQLLEEGRLSPDSALVRDVLGRDTHPAIRSALIGMGISPETALAPSPAWEERMLELLTVIGADKKRQADVRSSTELEPSTSPLKSFLELGEEWRSRILSLAAIVRSEKIPAMQKLVAVGALFYLITPFDLIPDHLPVIGLMDDYAVLGLAVAYYARKFARAPSETGTEVS